MNKENLEPWVTTREGAEATGYTPEHVARLAKRGQVRALRVGDRWLVDIEDLKRWQATARTGPKPGSKRKEG